MAIRFKICYIKTPKHFYLGEKSNLVLLHFIYLTCAKVRIKSEIYPIFLGYILK